MINGQQGVKIPQRFSPYLLIRQLSKELYSDQQALAELLRNSANAFMGTTWDPKRVKIEISLVTGHPLSPKRPAMLFFDSGSGITEAAYKSMESIGPSGDKSLTALHGSSQKNIGRLAPLKLIRAVRDHEDIDSGFHVFTRALSSGPVEYFHYTANRIVSNQVERITLPPDVKELGPYRNISGSFTLIIVPDVIFRDEDHIRRMLEWSLPRFRNLAMNVKVGDKLLESPPLQKHFKEAAGIVAYLGRPKEASKDTGCWITDLDTGFRCAFAPHMERHLPYPFQGAELEGDIGIRGVLRMQDTGRSKLLLDYLKSKEWQRITDLLALHFSQFAQNLLGADAVINPQDPGHQTMMDFADMFDTHFGVPNIRGGDLPGVVAGGREFKDENKPPAKKRPTRRLRAQGRKHPAEDGKVRGRAVNIGDHAYILRLSPTANKLVYAFTQSEGGNVLFVNPNFSLRCGSASAQREHLLFRLLLAVGAHQEPDDFQAAELHAAAIRERLTQKK